MGEFKKKFKEKFHFWGIDDNEITDPFGPMGADLFSIIIEARREFPSPCPTCRKYKVGVRDEGHGCDDEKCAWKWFVNWFGGYTMIVGGGEE